MVEGAQCGANYSGVWRNGSAHLQRDDDGGGGRSERGHVADLHAMAK